MGTPKASKELSWPQFAHAVCRIALHVYSDERTRHLQPRLLRGRGRAGVGRGSGGGVGVGVGVGVGSPSSAARLAASRMREEDSREGGG